MKNVFHCTKPLFAVVLLFVLIGSASWQNRSKNKVQQSQNFVDTTKPQQSDPDKNEPRVKDLDEAMKELEEAMKKLEVEMKKIDMGKIEKEIKEAMAKVDMKKIEQEMKASMEKIDWKKIREEIEKSMKDAEIKMKEIDLSQLEKEMAELKINMEKQKFDFKVDGEKIRQQVEEGMKKAKVEMEKAREEMKYLQEFTDELQKDGLIDKKKGYKVQLKDGELYINGTKQSKETSDKYRRFYKKDNFTINTNGDTIIEI
jgi:hypothetical protein